MMGELNIIEKACAFCCGIMAEMGDLLEMSYQKVNVILFCWLEPALFIGLLFTLLWGWGHLPWRRRLAWISLAINTLTILTISVLLCISTTMLLKQFHEGLEDPMSILNLNESSSAIVNQFNNTVWILAAVGGKVGLSYAAVNLIYYAILLPTGIILCYWNIIKNLQRKS